MIGPGLLNPVLEVPVSQVRFLCAGCGKTLGVRAELAGKVVACPVCKRHATVPGFEVVDEPAAPPPPPPEQLVRYPCSKCGAELTIGVSRIGQAVPCSECGQRTLVPEQDEVGTYGLGDAKKGGRREHTPSQPVAGWWPDARQANLPHRWRGDLADAREDAENGRWKPALTLLHRLYRECRPDSADGRALRKPLAICLARWAARELDRVEAGSRLSTPIRKALQRVLEGLKWGVAESEVCPACGRQFQKRAGQSRLHTVAGSVYLCCATPTAGDEELIQRVHGIAKKLGLASALEPGNAEAAAVLARLPTWYRAVELRPIACAEQQDAAAEPGVGSQFLGDLLGEVLKNILSG